MSGPGAKAGAHGAQAGTMTRGSQARALVRGHRSGVLSTHSVKHPGYPYGSALPHVTDHAGRPVVLISHLAEHTHNLEADPRASFIVCAQGPDLQAQPRVTVLGETRPVADQAAIAARYLRFYPEHEQYLQIGGFGFFVARAVAGALHPGLRRTALDRRRQLSRGGRRRRWPKPSHRCWST